jgi:hypothetical protein
MEELENREKPVPANLSSGLGHLSGRTIHSQPRLFPPDQVLQRGLSSVLQLWRMAKLPMQGPFGVDDQPIPQWGGNGKNGRQRSDL